MISTLADVRVTGSQYGGRFTRGRPKFIVVHSVECPLKDGQAKFRMELLSNRDDASGHYLVDPSTIAAGVDEDFIAWGAGTVNSSAIHIEFVGYHYYSRADWTTDSGIAMLKRGGALIADVARRHGIPLRLLSTAELKSAWRSGGTGGIVTHMQCTAAIGGTTHVDPGNGFPLDLLLSYAQGKATQTGDEDDMQLTDKVTVRDPLMDPIDQSYSIAQIYQKQVNYLGSIVNKLTRIEDRLDALEKKAA